MKPGDKVIVLINDRLYNAVIEAQAFGGTQVTVRVGDIQFTVPGSQVFDKVHN